MATLTITIDTGNAAFADDACTEVARILHKLAAKYEDVSLDNTIVLHDINGNPVGKAKYGEVVSFA